MGVYLDYNASTPIESRVLDYMIEIYKNAIGNADSRTHDFGDKARSVVEDARGKVASLIGCNSDEVFFTSGATESNNIALQGLKQYAEETGRKHIITSTIEHKAVLETVRFMENNGFEVDYVDPDKNGRIGINSVLDKIRDNTLVVSIMHANNETGVIQPIEELGHAIKEKGVLFHTDATQTCGKLVKEIKHIDYDMLSLSAHKFYGPQGVGALILRRKKYKLPPVQRIVFGGKQEKGIRPGTIPVALVAGLGKACEIADNEYDGNMKNCLVIKDALIKVLNESGIRYSINGDVNYTMPNTLNICLEGISSEAMMIATKQYCAISNGSACTSSDYSPSYVLRAMGLDDDRILSSVRISWSGSQSKDEIINNFQDMVSTILTMQ